MTTIYEFSAHDAEGRDISLQDYQGKVLLIINSATRCGLNPQYKGLQALYEKYREQGFEILDFPCNQFMKQSPEPIEEIVACRTEKFGVEFKIFDKIDVNGDNALPLYTWLIGQKQEEKGGAAFKPLLQSLVGLRGPIPEGGIEWNFTKFLIDREGNVVERFAPGATHNEIEADIQKLLA